MLENEQFIELPEMYAYMRPRDKESISKCLTWRLSTLQKVNTTVDGYKLVIKDKPDGGQGKDDLVNNKFSISDSNKHRLRMRCFFLSILLLVV